MPQIFIVKVNSEWPHLMKKPPFLSMPCTASEKIFFLLALQTKSKYLMFFLFRTTKKDMGICEICISPIQISPILFEF